MAIPTGMTGQAPSGVVDNLFRPTVIDNQVNVGDLITFRYKLWRHDPRPVVVVDKIKPGIYVRGVNIHYLPFGEIRNLFGISANNQAFNYQRDVKGRPYLSASLRTYKYGAIDMGSLEILDYQFVMQVMSLVRTFDPMEVEKMRELVSEQLNTQVNPRAADITTDALAPPQAPAAPTPTIGPVPPTGPTPPQAPGPGI